MTPEQLKAIRDRDAAIQRLATPTVINGLRIAVTTTTAEQDRHALLEHIATLTICAFCSSPLTTLCTGTCRE